MIMTTSMSATTSIQPPQTISGPKSPLISSLPQILTKVSKAFPGSLFSVVARPDFGFDVVVHDIDLYLSPAFDVFLDELAQTLTDEEYMLLDFCPPLLGSEKHLPVSSYNLVIGRATGASEQSRGILQGVVTQVPLCKAA